MNNEPVWKVKGLKIPDSSCEAIYGMDSFHQG